MSAMNLAPWLLQAWIAMVVALCIDQWIGEPPPRWHPVVWMGRYLNWAGKWLQRRVKQTHPLSPIPSPAQGGGECCSDQQKNPDAEKPLHPFSDSKNLQAHTCSDSQPDTSNSLPSYSPLPPAGEGLGERGQHTPSRDLASFWRGAAAWWLGAIAITAAACAAQWLLWQLPWGWTALALGVLLKPLLAWRMLADEVLAVEQQLEQSLPQGQQQLARIVSRDTSVLDATQVRESAIESLAENLNDSVMAPLFWFVLLGLPGAALYRYADTADSMWGYRGSYRGQHWEWAGKWAARADDVLAWLPARFTAMVLMLGSGFSLVAQLPAQASLTPSPNSGWP
ncbi:MAG: CobD/CbiB family cobalamin biosynthesis protein, partial [Brachymonas sp.]|nr:CobD/CbiB family cobalamin biosynthesis protein [Brachymonas sp.]